MRIPEVEELSRREALPRKKVGFVGLGKLGLPCALAAEMKGHTVYGYDISPRVKEIVDTKKLPYKEEGAQELLNSSKLTFTTSLHYLLSESDIVFVPIQTPHDPKYEGITRIPDERIDFDYSYLRDGIEAIAKALSQIKKHVTVIIISTVLPGTIEREIKPLLNEYIHLCYNPFFIAMGTTVHDFLNPEFVLLGCEDDHIAQEVTEFYSTIHSKPVFRTDIKTAELIKVAYNTFIGFKIVFINAMMEICHKTGANVDHLSAALSLATERLISPKYMLGGMGDGGGCHPRDNIAMSWLAQKIDLSHDIFSDMMKTREDQTEWLADILLKTASSHQLPIVILGKAYKPETNLCIGSPSVLLSHLLTEKGKRHTIIDPYIEDDTAFDFGQSVFFIGTKHEEFKSYKFPFGSVVIDPFGYIPNQDGIEVIHIGRP